MPRTFKHLKVTLVDSRGERYDTQLDEQQLDARGVLDSFSSFLAAKTFPEDWAQEDKAPTASFPVPHGDVNTEERPGDDGVRDGTGDA